MYETIRNQLHGIMIIVRIAQVEATMPTHKALDTVKYGLELLDLVSQELNRAMDKLEESEHSYLVDLADEIESDLIDAREKTKKLIHTGAFGAAS